MGKVSKRVLGAVKGKVGDVAFRDWRQMPVVATYATENDSKTEKQVAQRTLMSQVSSMLSKALCPIRLGFPNAKVGTTEWATAIKKNWDTLVVNGVFSPENFLNLQFSEGGLKEIYISAVNYNASANTIVVEWAYSPLNPCGKNNPDDQVLIMVAPLTEEITFKDQFVTSVADRSAGTITLSLPEGWDYTPDTFALYAFAYNNEDASRTTHYGEEPVPPHDPVVTFGDNITASVGGSPITSGTEVKPMTSVTFHCTHYQPDQMKWVVNGEPRSGFASTDLTRIVVADINVTLIAD